MARGVEGQHERPCGQQSLETEDRVELDAVSRGDVDAHLARRSGWRVGGSGAGRVGVECSGRGDVDVGVSERDRRNTGEVHADCIGREVRAGVRVVDDAARDGGARRDRVPCREASCTGGTRSSRSTWGAVGAGSAGRSGGSAAAGRHVVAGDVEDGVDRAAQRVQRDGAGRRQPDGPAVDLHTLSGDGVDGRGVRPSGVGRVEREVTVEAVGDREVVVDRGRVGRDRATAVGAGDLAYERLVGVQRSGAITDRLARPGVEQSARRDRHE